MNSKIGTSTVKTLLIGLIVLTVMIVVLWFMATGPRSSHTMAQITSPDGKYKLVVKAVDYGGSYSLCPSGCGGIHSEAFLIQKNLFVFQDKKRIRLPFSCGTEGAPEACQESLEQLNWSKILALPVATEW